MSNSRSNICTSFMVVPARLPEETKTLAVSKILSLVPTLAQIQRTSNLAENARAKSQPATSVSNWSTFIFNSSV